MFAFSALTLLVGRPVKTERWGAGMVVCLERGADLHMYELMPLPLTVSCFNRIQIGLLFWYRLTQVVLFCHCFYHGCVPFIYMLFIYILAVFYCDVGGVCALLLLLLTK